MIADRTRTSRPNCLWLTGALALVVGLGLLALPSRGLSAPHDHGNSTGHSGHTDCAGDCDHGGHGSAKAGAPVDRKVEPPKKDSHAAGPPELPNIAYAIGVLFPDTKIGKFLGNHGNWYVVRPFFSLLVVLIFLFAATTVYKRRSTMPGRFQTAMEMIVEALDNLVCGILGPKIGRAYLPFLGGLFIYILCLNLFGLLPLGMSPTAGHGLLSTGMLVPTATTALALSTLCVTQYTAVRQLGIKGMILHWCGSPSDVVTWIIGIIFMPLHIFSDFVIKPLSLLLRLFGNIYGEDVLLGSMLVMGMGILAFLPKAGIPVGFPLQLPFMFLATLTSTIQALVFTLLSTIYIMMVLPHEDHDEHHDEAHAHG